METVRNMKIYLDLVLMLNFVFDFLLLTAVSTFLRRNISLTRLIIGSFIGGISIFTLFIHLNSFQLFLIKLFISIIMCLVTFNYRNLKYTLKNMFYLYTTSMILGGFLYFLNILYYFYNLHSF